MVHGFFTFNLGDDLFLKILIERYPETLFYIYAPKGYKKLFKMSRNLRVIPSKFFFIRAINYIFRKIFNIDCITLKLLSKRCDAVVHIGGSLFVQGENWEKQLIRTRERLIQSKPYYLLGANFGPFNRMDYYNKHKEIFSQYTDICFRETYSYNLFKDLENVRFADDIVFQLKTENMKGEDKNILISVINPSRKSLNGFDEIYYTKIRDISVFFVEKGYSITLMSFCEFEGDDIAVKKILGLVPQSYHYKIKEHYYKKNLEQTLNLFAKSSFIIATRFHSMILGWIHNKPVFPIVYSNKMTNVIDDIGFNSLYIDFNSLQDLEGKVVLESIHKNTIEVTKKIQSAANHFYKLDEFLSESINVKEG